MRLLFSVIIPVLLSVLFSDVVAARKCSNNFVRTPNFCFLTPRSCEYVGKRRETLNNVLVILILIFHFQDCKGGKVCAFCQGESNPVGKCVNPCDKVCTS